MAGASDHDTLPATNVAYLGNLHGNPSIAADRGAHGHIRPRIQPPIDEDVADRDDVDVRSIRKGDAAHEVSPEQCLAFGWAQHREHGKRWASSASWFRRSRWFVGHSRFARAS